MSQSEQIKEITEKLQQGIEDLFESEKYKNYLKTMSKFTSYSLNNTMLIAMQKPDATTVAGYGTWKQMHRHIKKGSKGIKILSPIIYKKKDIADITDTADKSIIDKDNKDISESEKVLVGFKIVNVFDISQTEGEPLPEIAHKLDGSVDNYNDFMAALKQFSPVPIEFETIGGNANGYYHLVDKNIVVDDGMSQMMNVKTTIHEIAHAMLHDKDNGLEKDALPDRETQEVQAEAIAFSVSHFFGVDTSDYSFGYIGGWSSGKDLKELKSSLETIRQTSQIIINGINQKLDAIKQSKQLDLNISATKDNISINKPAHKMSMGH